MANTRRVRIEVEWMCDENEPNIDTMILENMREALDDLYQGAAHANLVDTMILKVVES